MRRRKRKRKRKRKKRRRCIFQLGVRFLKFATFFLIMPLLFRYPLV